MSVGCMIGGECRSGQAVIAVVVYQVCKSDVIRVREILCGMYRSAVGNGRCSSG